MAPAGRRRPGNPTPMSSLANFTYVFKLSGSQEVGLFYRFGSLADSGGQSGLSYGILRENIPQQESPQ